MYTISYKERKNKHVRRAKFWLEIISDNLKTYQHVPMRRGPLVKILASGIFLLNEYKDLGFPLYRDARTDGGEGMMLR